MTAPIVRWCPECGGHAQLFESRKMKTVDGRRRRYRCLDPACGKRWNEWEGRRSACSLRQSQRAAGTAAGLPTRLCAGCLHYLREGCGLGFPEAVADPTFATLCSAWQPRPG
jgi:hypothetical protein